VHACCSPLSQSNMLFPAGTLQCTALLLNVACSPLEHTSKPTVCLSHTLYASALCRCNALSFPALHPSYGLSTQSRCMPNARAKCSVPGMWSCSGCHNWVVLQAECGEAGQPLGGQQCERRGNYSVMRQAPNVGHGRRCVAANRWMVLPNIACTGELVDLSV
jgi:hypothetical protein